MRGPMTPLTVRPAPQWHLLRNIVLSLLAGGIVLGSSACSDSARETPSQTQVGPRQIEQVDTAPVVTPPAQTEPEISAPATPLIMITMRWQEIAIEDGPYESDRWGKDESGVYSADENGGGIPMGAFIGTGTARHTIVYIKDVRMTTGSSQEYPLQFSPDGKRWYQLANLPEQALNAQVRGASWDGNDILIVANWQYEPWQYKVYVARVTPEDLKRASP